jgi:hypothetical protein
VKSAPQTEGELFDALSNVSPCARGRADGGLLSVQFLKKAKTLTSGKNMPRRP